MKVILAAAAVWHLVIMPNPGLPRPSDEVPTAQNPHPVLPSIMTQQNKDLFKPFDTGRTFDSEEACRADGKARLTEYLRERGLPDGVTANIACSLQ